MHLKLSPVGIVLASELGGISDHHAHIHYYDRYVYTIYKI